MRKHHRPVDASVEASRPHDFAVRFQVARLAHQKRPSHPAPNVRDDREAPLLWARDARRGTTDLPDGTSAIFSERRLDSLSFDLPDEANTHQAGARTSVGADLVRLDRKERRLTPHHTRASFDTCRGGQLCAHAGATQQIKNTAAETIADFFTIAAFVNFGALGRRELTELRNKLSIFKTRAIAYRQEKM
jgi:hypothetical protein